MLNDHRGTLFSRRRFLHSVLAGGAWMTAAPFLLALPARSAEAAQPWMAFEFDVELGTAIFIRPARDPQRLDITVRSGEMIVEGFPNAHPRRLDRLDSRYFTVRYVEPPGT